MVRTWLAMVVVVMLALAVGGAAVQGQDPNSTDPNAVRAVVVDGNDNAGGTPSPVVDPAPAPTLAAGQWSVGAMFDYKTIEAEFLYRPTADQGVGVRAICLDSGIGDALGFLAVTKFGMSDVYQAALDRIFPGDISLDRLPMKSYAELGAGWDLQSHQYLFLSGTGVELFPDRNIRPVVWTEYIATAGGASGTGLGSQFRTMVGFVVQF
jgi:hypothetical protein